MKFAPLPAHEWLEAGLAGDVALISCEPPLRCAALTELDVEAASLHGLDEASAFQLQNCPVGGCTANGQFRRERISRHGESTVVAAVVQIEKFEVGAPRRK